MTRTRDGRWRVSREPDHPVAHQVNQAGSNRGVETDQLSPCQFATTAAIGGRTAATADITTAAVVE